MLKKLGNGTNILSTMRTLCCISEHGGLVRTVKDHKSPSARPRTARVAWARPDVAVVASEACITIPHQREMPEYDSWESTAWGRHGTVMIELETS